MPRSTDIGMDEYRVDRVKGWYNSRKYRFYTCTEEQKALDVRAMIGTKWKWMRVHDRDKSLAKGVGKG